ncbi:MAG: hypothetical protein O9296_13465, partial [Novosphingobium sp.]|nr:hypothetical protein [Novosphingobium sp.]
LVHPGQGWEISHWREDLESSSQVELSADDGTPALFKHGNLRYLTAWPEQDLAREVLGRAARDADLPQLDLPEGLRMRRVGDRRFFFNYAAHPIRLPNDLCERLILGTPTLPPAGVAILQD